MLYSVYTAYYSETAKRSAAAGILSPCPLSEARILATAAAHETRAPIIATQPPILNKVILGANCPIANKRKARHKSAVVAINAVLLLRVPTNRIAAKIAQQRKKSPSARPYPPIPTSIVPDVRGKALKSGRKTRPIARRKPPYAVKIVAVIE